MLRFAAAADLLPSDGPSARRHRARAATLVSATLVALTTVRRSIARLVMLGLLLAGTVVVAPAAQATFPGDDGRIAFVRAGNIWVMDPDGTEQRQLTAYGVDAHPRWSADGRMLAFDRSTDGGGDIWVIPWIGAAPYRVTKHEADDRSPAWSPDGRWLVFSSDRRGRPELFRIRSSVPFGTPIRLTTTSGTGVPDPSFEDPYLADHEPSWSPSGDRIAFRRLSVDDDTSSSGWAYILFTVRPNGEGLAKAEGTGGLGPRAPTWGPGGARILFTDSQYFYEGFSSDNVWHVAPDGTSPVQVTHYPSDLTGERIWQLGAASWSPDRGRWIVFSGQSPWRRRPAIYRVRSSDASPPLLVTHNGSDPDWGVVPR